MQAIFRNEHRNNFKFRFLTLVILLLPVLIACIDSEKESSEAAIGLFTFQPEQNSGLDEIIIGEISEYNINLKVPYNVSLSELVATFSYMGVKVELQNVDQISGVTSNDFSNPVIYQVIAANGESAQYTVIVTNAPPRLPRVYINTEDNFEFKDNDKETYVNSTIRIEDLDNYYTTDTEVVTVHTREYIHLQSM